jgi:hypothetical protein
MRLRQRGVFNAYLKDQVNTGLTGNMECWVRDDV